MNITDCPLCGAMNSGLVCFCCEQPLTQGIAELLMEKSEDQQVMCKRCRAIFPCYLCLDEQRADLARLRKSLISNNQGRNLNCWPLGSFGWKHADCDPCGCTGIAGIVGVVEDNLIIAVGGHKIIVSIFNEDSDETDADADAYMEYIDEILSAVGVNSEWDGDTWTLCFSDRLLVPWNRNIELLADTIYTMAQQRCHIFSKKCIEATNLIQEVHTEYIKNQGMK